jgi:DNA-binding response OmpR family regulator
MAKKVLVVEDDQDVAGMFLDMFIQSDFSPEVVNDGKKALELLGKKKFDLMILDLMLPKMSGEDVLRNLEADSRFKGFPILVNSTKVGTSWNDEFLRGFKNLRIELLQRPCSPEILFDAIRALINPSTEKKAS